MSPILRRFVAEAWASDDAVSAIGSAATGASLPGFEHVLPTGKMHIVFRLDGQPLQVADPADGQGMMQSMAASGIVGGARAGYYVKTVAGPMRSVGVVLEPGAARLLLGETASALAGRHTRLDDLWGTQALHLHERLIEAGTAQRRLVLLEEVLIERLRRAEPARRSRVHGPDPAIAAVIGRIEFLPSVASAARESGYSHRHFIARFREDVGLAPGTYRRVRRFQRALQALTGPAAGTGDDPLAAIAADAGYSDQAHFNRDFLGFTGLTPGDYRRRGPREANHLPVDGLGQFHSRPAGPVAANIGLPRQWRQRSA